MAKSNKIGTDIDKLYKIQDYPKSSCLCQNCPGIDGTSCGKGSAEYFIQPERNDVVPTSLGLGNCYEGQPLEKCYNRRVYAKDQQPALWTKDTSALGFGPVGSDIHALNKLGLTIVPGYTEIECKDGSGGCPGTTYLNHDPRLLNAVTGDYIKLDRPPLTGDVAVGNVCLDQIYNDQYAKYGQCYSNYSTITGGQIQYYIDNSIADAYYQPLFVLPAEVHHEILIDPMSAVRPQYHRTPKMESSKRVHKSMEWDQFTADTLDFRESLMSRQMRKMNEQNYSMRWKNNVCKVN